MQSFADMYSPKHVDEIVSQETAIKKIKDFLENCQKHKGKRALLVYGPSGTGKTCAIKAIANDSDYEIIELDSENFEDESVFGAVRTGSLFRKKKIILIDDIENYYKNLSAVSKIIRTSNFPVVLVALDIWDQKLKFLRLASEKAEFKKIRAATIAKHLSHVLKSQGIRIDDNSILEISRNANGDLRAALNDLEFVIEGKNADISLLQKRNEESKMFDSVQTVFKSKDINKINESFNNLDIDPSLAVLWIAENISKEYETPEEIAEAYNYISRSDVFRGRITRQQHWGFMRYSIILSTLGVALSKKRTYRKFVRYDKPAKISKLIESRSFRSVTKTIANKIAASAHTSSRTAEKYYIPMLRFIFKKKHSWSENLAKELELQKEEIAFLTG